VKEPPVPLNRMLGGLQNQSGCFGMGKISYFCWKWNHSCSVVRPGHYTDCVVLAAFVWLYTLKKCTDFVKAIDHNIECGGHADYA
jgi:hypothetical protein